MKEQYQGRSECLLTAVCNVADISLSKAREHFQGVSWEMLVHLHCHKVMAQVLHELVPQVEESVWRNLMFDAMPISATSNDLVGKGILVVHFGAPDACLSRHALSYEDGLIQDPNHPKELLTFEELNSHLHVYYSNLTHNGWFIDSIVPFPKKEGA